MADYNSKIQELNAAFNIFDKDGNGVITADELTAMLRSLSDYHTDEDITYIMNMADENSDGVIDIQEFQNMVESNPWLLGSFENSFLSVFNQHDLDKDGYLTFEELEHGLARLNVVQESDQVLNAMQSAGVEDANKINYHKFAEILQAI
ncbi:hypothetical protein IWW50_001744 [Coemansia erecta]|nr:hypothetical protein IWW50_001744 [Coemansia erecta]